MKCCFTCFFEASSIQPQLYIALCFVSSLFWLLESIRHYYGQLKFQKWGISPIERYSRSINLPKLLRALKRIGLSNTLIYRNKALHYLPVWQIHSPNKHHHYDSHCAITTLLAIEETQTPSLKWRAENPIVSHHGYAGVLVTAPNPQGWNTHRRNKGNECTRESP